MKRTQRIGDGQKHDNAIPGTRPGSSQELHALGRDRTKAAIRSEMRNVRHRLKHGCDAPPRPDKPAKARRTPPDEMPPMPEWGNPVLKRSVEDFGDNMRLRRARQRGAETGRPVIRRLIIARDNSTCWICRRVLEDHEIHLDHVIPLIRGGRHDPENVKVACAPCNLWKGDRIIKRVESGTT